jgi:hypothetical protein
MNETNHRITAMSVANIPIAAWPHVQGFIRIATAPCEDGSGASRTIDSFEILDRVHCQEGALPVDGGAPARASHPIAHSARLADDTGAVRVIPITIAMEKASTALRAHYQAFTNDPDNPLPVCTGDGRQAIEIRTDAGGESRASIACAGPHLCPKVLSGLVRCKRQVRLAVQIAGQDDPWSIFEVRSGSLNTYKALLGQLAYMEKRFGGLRHIPLQLSTWAMSSAASHYKVFHAMRLTLGAQSEKAALQARQDALAEFADDPFGFAGAAQDEPAADEWDVVRVFYDQPLEAAREPTTEATPTLQGKPQAPTPTMSLATMIAAATEGKPNHTDKGTGHPATTVCADVTECGTPGQDGMVNACAAAL